MSPQPTVAQIRFKNIVAALSTAVTIVRAIADGLNTPFLEPISTTMQSLLTIAPMVKKNKDDLIQILEQIHELLYIIIHLHTTSETRGELSPYMLKNLGQFAETLHKVHTFVEAQQEKSIIKHFFRYGEMSTLLKGCQSGLAQALQVFKVQTVNISSDVTQMQQYSQKTHAEVLELISAFSDDGNSDQTSLLSRDLKSSSNSLSLLPSEPKIFHGCESEVSAIIQAFRQDTPRVAILGAGGMGKTSLARAVLHHPEIASRYEEHRVFVACDTCSNSLQLAALLGGHIGLKPGKDLTQPCINHFSTSSPSLLILDNLETLWEPVESRKDAEEFLSSLTDVEHLALIITMRGAERPANIRWTHPFLEPLKPLTQDATRQIFIDITDEGYSYEDIDKIMLPADNMPLAINLIAHLVDYEGMDSVLHRWETDKTSLLSEGHDKGSNLDLSISLSLDSPRLAAAAEAQNLLGLLSFLPDGLSDVELVQSQLPIDNILACKAALLRTSLAYMDEQRRLKTLVPIREYMQKKHPPLSHLVQPLLRHFQDLVQLYHTEFGTAPAAGVVPRIASNFTNIRNILLKGLHPDNPEMIDTIYSICNFDSFSVLNGLGRSQLLDHIPPSCSDHRAEFYFITQHFGGYSFHLIPGVDDLVNQGLTLFPQFDDPDLKCKFYRNIANHYANFNISRALEFSQIGLSLAASTGNTARQSELLSTQAWIKWQVGDFSTARMHAYEAQRLAKISAALFQEAWALRIESSCWRALGNYSHSLALLKRAQDLFKLCGLSGGSLDTDIVVDLAEAHYMKTEYVDAQNIHTQILHNASIEHDPHQHALALLNIAQIEVEISASSQDVQKKLDTVISLFKTPGNPIGTMWAEIIGAALYLREQEFSVARTVFQKYFTLARDKNTEMASHCLQKLGDVQLWNAREETSATWAVILLVHSLKLKEKLGIYKAFQSLGLVYLAQGELHTAMQLFSVALEGFTWMDIHRSRAECMIQLGDLFKLREDLEMAVGFWETARSLFERSAQMKQVCCIDKRLERIGFTA